MGLNFRKSINIGKGVRVNLSKSGPSISFGTKGLRFSLNSKGSASANVGIPGTGVYYNKRVNIWDTVKKFFGSEENLKKDQLETDLQAGNKTGTEELQIKVELQNNLLERLKNVHKESDDFIDWEEVKNTQDTATEAGKNVRDLAEQVLAGNDEAYLTVINEMEPFSDLTEFGSEFEVGIVEDEFLGVNFNINSDSTIPNEVVTILKSGKESVKPMSKTMRNTLKRDYMISTVLRIGRDTFALLPIKQLAVNAEDKIVNPMTGNAEDITLLSVIFDRETFMKLNFDGIIPAEALKNFEHNLDFKPLKGLQPVLPLK